jgi:hypothetical protein
MRRQSEVAFRVYEEDEFFAAPGEEWRSDTAAPALRPRFRRLAFGTLLAGAIFAVGGALALERLPSRGGSRPGAMARADGSRSRYLAARSASAPIRARLSGNASQGNGGPGPPRARRAQAGAVARRHPRALRTPVTAVRARMTARAGSVTTSAVPAAAPVPAYAPRPGATPVPAAAPASAGRRLASVARGAAYEPAAGEGTAAGGPPVASASSGASRRQHPEFGFER